MKKLLSLAAAAIMAMSLAACKSENPDNEKNGEPAAYQDISQPAKSKNNETLFGKYVSNTVISTGCNSAVDEAQSVTYRAYFPVEEYGQLEYCFYFSNNVDSTYKVGKKEYTARKGGDFTIESARIGTVSSADIDGEITDYCDITFGGAKEKSVASGETFWSDPVSYNVSEGNYLVWEWTLTGTDIPAINMSELTKTGADYGDGNGLVYCDKVPMPQLIGADRDVKYTVSAMGDSITQGCGTESMAYEYWASEIYNLLGDDYSLWNCGLGSARASDAALNGDWFERTSQSDIVILAFGTNDIVSGEYGGDGGNTASEIDAYVRELLTKLKEKECGIIVFNAPPFDYREDKEAVRTKYNELLKTTCEEFEVAYFDFASLLSDEANPAKAKYGSHPTGEAGSIVAQEFIEQYKAFFDAE